MSNHSMDAQDEMRLDTPPKRRLVFLHYILIIAAILLTYSNTFHVPFQFDDFPNIVNNPIVKNFGYYAKLSREQPTQFHPSFYTHYVGLLTFAFNYKISGLNVVGYHVVNLLIHVTNALLVYIFVQLCFKAPLLQGSNIKEQSHIIALISALLFACHPVETQAVTYIVQRYTSLASLFYLLSLTLYLKWRLEYSPSLKAITYYVLSIITAILAMKTKEIAFTLPIMIVLFEFMFFKESIKRRMLYLIGPFLTILIIPLTMIDISKPFGHIISQAAESTIIYTELSRWDYLLTQFSVIVTYIRLLLLPINLNLDYDYPIFHFFFNTRVFLSFLVIVGMICLGFYLLYKSRIRGGPIRIVSFGIFWFFITLSVESSFIPIADVIFEHRLYLSGIGFLLASVTSVFWLMRKFGGKKISKAAILTLALIVGLLSFATYTRNSVWRTEISLWEDVVSKSPEKARPYFSLGYAYAKKEMSDRAIEQYLTALKQNPDYLAVYLNLGILYRQNSMLDEAIEQFENALRIKPGVYSEFINTPGLYAEVYFNLGIVYLQKNMFDKAIENFRAALRVRPSYLEALINLGTAYFKKGLVDEAIEHYQSAISVNPDHADAHYNLYLAYRKKGMNHEAIKHLQKAKNLGLTMSR